MFKMITCRNKRYTDIERYSVGEMSGHQHKYQPWSIYNYIKNLLVTSVTPFSGSACNGAFVTITLHSANCVME